MAEEKKANQLPDRSEVKAEDTWRLRIFFLVMKPGIKNFKL